MKPWLFLIVAAITGGIGGFILGKASSSNAANRSENNVVVQGNGLLGSGANAATRSLAPSSMARGNSGSASGRLNPAVLRRELETIKRDSNPINRFASLTQLLSGLSPDNLDAVLSAFDEIPMRYEHREEYQMLVYAWASFDPEAALKFVGENANSRSINKNDLMRPLVASWASNDPDETLEWLKTLPEKQQKDTNLLSGLMEGWAVKDPYAAAEYLQTNVEAGKNRERLAGEIASHLFKQNPAEAAKWAESHSDLKFREEAFEELAEDWASVNPGELANWLGDHIDEAYSIEAFEDLARGWVSQDPDAATSYFESLPDGPAKESGIYEMARTWGKDDLGALGEWLNGLPDSNVTDLGVKAYTERLVGQSPEAAIESAMSINNDDLRNEAVQMAGQHWFRQNPEAATAWADANGVPVESFHSSRQRTVIVDGQVITLDGAPSGVTHRFETNNALSPDQIREIQDFQAVEELKILEGEAAAAAAAGGFIGGDVGATAHFGTAPKEN